MADAELLHRSAVVEWQAYTAIHSALSHCTNNGASSAIFKPGPKLHISRVLLDKACPELQFHRRFRSNIWRMWPIRFVLSLVVGVATSFIIINWIKHSRGAIWGLVACACFDVLAAVSLISILAFFQLRWTIEPSRPAPKGLWVLCVLTAALSPVLGPAVIAAHIFKIVDTWPSMQSTLGRDRSSAVAIIIMAVIFVFIWLSVWLSEGQMTAREIITALLAVVGAVGFLLTQAYQVLATGNTVVQFGPRWAAVKTTNTNEPLTADTWRSAYPFSTCVVLIGHSKNISSCGHHGLGNACPLGYRAVHGEVHQFDVECRERLYVITDGTAGEVAAATALFVAHGFVCYIQPETECSECAAKMAQTYGARVVISPVVEPWGRDRV